MTKSAKEPRTQNEREAAQVMAKGFRSRTPGAPPRKWRPWRPDDRSRPRYPLKIGRWIYVNDYLRVAAISDRPWRRSLLPEFNALANTNVQ